MEKTKKLFSFLAMMVLAICLLFSFGGCDTGTGGNTGNGVTNGATATAVVLNQKEKKIYDCIIANIGDFYNPSAVRVVQVETFEEDAEFCYVKIQATNKVGGTLSKVYALFFDDGSMLNMEDDDLGYLKKENISGLDEDVNCGNINKKIKEYVENLGL